MRGIIMAGGRASRLSGKREKALLEVGGRTLLDRATEALRTDGIDDIVVAVTKATPRTRELARNTELNIFQTSAEGYHGDTLELLDAFGPYISLNVDIPFIRQEHVRRMRSAIASDSLAAVVPLSIAMRIPDRDSVGDGGTIWVGLNYVTTSPETSQLVYDDPLLSININTEGDLAFANMIASKQEMK